jgi:hypothetical protein
MSERPPQSESEIVELVRSIDVPAPPELHRRIDALIAERAPAARRAPAPLRLGVAGALALAVIAVALIVGLSGGGGGSKLTLHSAVALTLRSPTMPAPTQDPHNATELAADVEGVAFPYWEDSFGWRAAGARVDRLDGRRVTTVFYARGHGQWIGYAILAGAAPRIGGGVVREREGTSYRFSSVDGSSVVTWLREGHLCVVAGRGVDEPTLMALASWREHGTLTA